MQVQVNGEARDACQGTTLGTLVDTLELNRAHVAVELNRQLIPREQIDDHELSDGDCIEIVTLVGGG
ncbi:MAG: sulfur carrier protein ThiS [Planctomycetota bacterium]